MSSCACNDSSRRPRAATHVRPPLTLFGHRASSEVEFVLPTKLARDPLSTAFTECLPQSAVRDQPPKLPRELIQFSTASMKAVESVANQLGRPAGAIDEVRLSIRPGFEQHEPKRIGSRRECRDRFPRRIAFLLLGENTESPSLAKLIGNATRTRGNSASPVPRGRRETAPVVHAFSAANRRSIVPFSALQLARCPTTTSPLKRSIPQPLGFAFRIRPVDSEPLQMNARFRHAEVEHGVPLRRVTRMRRQPDTTTIAGVVPCIAVLLGRVSLLGRRDAERA